MDLPIKLNLPAFSHGQLLRLCCPIIPGSTAVVGLSIRNPSATKAILQWPLVNIYVKLCLALAGSYLLGLCLYFIGTTVTSFIEDLIRRQRWKKSDGLPWYRLEWRATVEAFLGENMAPAVKATKLAEYLPDEVRPEKIRTELATVKARSDELKAKVASAKSQLLDSEGQVDKELAKRVIAELEKEADAIDQELDKFDPKFDLANKHIAKFEQSNLEWLTWYLVFDKKTREAGSSDTDYDISISLCAAGIVTLLLLNGVHSGPAVWAVFGCASLTVFSCAMRLGNAMGVRSYEEQLNVRQLSYMLDRIAARPSASVPESHQQMPPTT